MSNSSLYAYRHEVFNFLKTVSIKFDAFSYILGKEYIAQYGVEDIENDPNNPYYLYLCGQYDHSISPIEVYSIEDKTNVLLTREFLATHPRSREIYKIPNVEYDTLLARYPDKRGIIQNIIYPAKDIDSVIAASNLSVLTYDSSLLHSGETESLLLAMDEFLTYVKTRWWVPEFSYENLYPIAFWMLLWESLPNVLLSQRVSNIRTNSVHPFHIWEYLVSNGLGDYRDIVTSNQALWLYRNLPWILKNKGKEIALYELAENILTEHRVDLCGIELIQSLSDSTDKCRTDPHFKSIYLPSGREDTIYSTDIMLDRIADAGLTKYYNADEKLQHNYDLAVTQDNLMSTKYIELRRRITSTRFEEILIEFLYSNLMYRYSVGDLNYVVNFQDPIFKLAYKFNMTELLYLLYYSIHRTFKVTPEYIPKYSNCELAYKREEVRAKDVDKWFSLAGSKFYTASYVDVNGTIGGIPLHWDSFISHDEYLTFIQKLFKHYHNEVINIDHGDALYREAMHTVYKEILVRPCRFIDLPEVYPGVTTYIELFDTNNVLKELVNNYEYSNLDLVELFNKLAVAIIDILIPIDTYREILGVNSYDKRIYDGLKNLFIQLCSYNITFLETEKRQFKDLPLPVILEHVDRSIRYSGRLYVVPDIDNYQVYTRYMCPLLYENIGVNILYNSYTNLDKVTPLPMADHVDIRISNDNSTALYVPLDTDISIITTP